MKRLLLLLAALATAGCGDGTATVSGTVTYQGRPVTFGAVTIRHADGKTARSGVIRPDGTYTVEGVERGPARVAVASPDPAKARVSVEKSTDDPPPEPKGKAKPAAKDKGGWVPLPRQYADPGTSGLTCDVNAGRVRYDIELK